MMNEDEGGSTKKQQRERKKLQRMLDEYRSKAADVRDNILETRPANAWLAGARNKRDARLLCGSLWREGELAIMFADTGVGKSIFAVQLGEAIARGRGIGPLATEVPRSRVIYLDFELTEQQFLMRYSGGTGGADKRRRYRFSKNFMRSQMVWDGEVPAAFRNAGELLSWSIIETLREAEARVVIVDNISYLGSSNESANAALSLMKGLKSIKAELGISILVLAHTPKRAFSRMLSVNDMQGSKMLANFADSVFAIGTGGLDHSLRYIKQIKVRSGVLDYGENNVVVFRLDKVGAFPRFTFIDERAESSFRTDGRSRSPEIARKLLTAEAKRLAKEEKLSEREIARRLGLSNATVHRYLTSE